MKTRILAIILILIFSSLACEINVGGPETPATPIPISTEEVSSLQSLWKTAFDQAKDTGTVTLTLTESQITSFLAFKLSSQENPVIADPQVYLRDEQIQIFGKVHRGYLTATARAVLQVMVNEDGLPKFELTSADFGPWPVPEELLSGLSATLDEAFTGKIGPAATGLRIETIQISDGLLTITGRVK